jgi:signal transduction histidine kinase
LINDILDISKVEAGRVDLLIEEFDASALLLEAAETVAPIAAKNGTRIVVVPSGVKRPCRTDIFKLRQCLLNLMSNACKFTRGGEIRLSVEECDMAGSRTLRFRIADTGIGMTPEQVGRLFHAFVQADPSITREFGGTGLGLVLTRQIARLLGGDVSVISAKDVGSTFTLWVTHQAISSPNDALSTTSVSAADAPIVAMSLANRADITELAATKTTSELRALGAAA